MDSSKCGSGVRVVRAGLMFSSLPYGYLSLYVLVRGTLLSISSSHWFRV